MAEEPKKRSRLATGLIIATIIILILVIGWHLLFPFLGITIALGAGAWGFVISTIVLLCVAIMLFFVLTGMGVLIVGFLAVAWTVLAISLFPILFPILTPILIILLFIAIVSRRKGR